MSAKDITSLRGAIQFLKDQGELLIIKNEVDPIYEIAGISKALDGGFPIFFENFVKYSMD